MKLHLGCGNNYLEGYVNIDIRGKKLDRKEDIRYLQFKENTVEEVRLHHVFEHFSRVEAYGLLIKWITWLAPGGKLTIEVPDFMATLSAINNCNHLMRMKYLRHLTGDQSQFWGFHKELWFESRFIATLTALGCEVERFHAYSWKHSPYLSNIICYAHKARNMSQAEYFHAGCDLLRQSMVSDKEQDTYNVWVEQLKGVVFSNEFPFGKRDSSDV
jgi:predicted SAM-dependent methyltransferase